MNCDTGWAMEKPVKHLGLLVGVAVLIAFSTGGLVPAEAAVLEVRAAGADTVSEGIAEKVKAMKGVAKVERYLLVRTQPHDVIGVEPDTPLRIVVTQDDKLIETKLETGKKFRKEDDGKNVAIVGNQVYAEDYGYRGGMGHMSRMKHLLEVGQTFKLTGEAGPRIRVLGTFSARPEPEAAKVFLPLATAQKLFSQEGRVSHLFVVVEGDPEAAAKELQAVLGAGVQVRIISP